MVQHWEKYSDDTSLMVECKADSEKKIKIRKIQVRFC